MNNVNFQLSGSSYQLSVNRSTGQPGTDTRHLVNRKPGFTLIELLVVISIIGVLMGIGFVAFKQAQTAGRDTKRKADLEQIKTALELFHEECGYYPPTLDFSQPSFVASCRANDPPVTYLAKIPKDPLDPTYTYWYGGTKNLHTLCAYFERGGGGYQAGGYTACFDGLRGRFMFGVNAVSCGAAVCNYSVLTAR